jgi:hypothetical protein
MPLSPCWPQVRLPGEGALDVRAGPLASPSPDFTLVCACSFIWAYLECVHPLCCCVGLPLWVYLLAARSHECVTLSWLVFFAVCGRALMLLRLSPSLPGRALCSR